MEISMIIKRKWCINKPIGRLLAHSRRERGPRFMAMISKRDYRRMVEKRFSDYRNGLGLI